MKDEKFFYETDQYLNIDFAQKEAELLAGKYIDRLFNNKDAIKRFKEEIYPTIKLAEYLQTPYIRFCGMENNSIDAELKNIDNEITKAECTSSINAHFNKLITEYNYKFGSCFIGPHSKTFKKYNLKQASSNDIVYNGTQHNRIFIKQENLNKESTFKNCIINVNEYVKEDIQKIEVKINKGNSKNKYKNFYLILACEHCIDIKQICEYKKLLSEYWQNVKPNPFSYLFVVNYDSVLFRQKNFNSELNPSYMPIPLFLIQR